MWLSLAATLLTAPASAVNFDWVTIGDPGNAADTTGYGAVAYAYEISRTEVTNTQYAEFLNAVAATDSYGAYNTEMGSDAMGGIDRSGAPGSYSYSVKPGFADRPVNFVGFWDVVRFANWLQNGHPSGLQYASTTEDGAYTLTASAIADNTVTRNAGATIFVPSEDEWYKAAYYDVATRTWYDYPTGTDVRVVCDAPGATPNTANCGWVVGDLVDVGLYTGSVGPFGTVDQAGNIWEWNEAIQASLRGVRGGGFTDAAGYIDSGSRSFGVADHEIPNVGFRIAQLSEPGGGPCDDALDNDADGLVDLDDPGCRDALWPTENPECSDGINNDPGADALIDFDGGVSAGLPAAEQTAPDPQCRGVAWDDREAAARCGLGIELAPLLALLVAWRRRSGRRA